MSKVSYTSSQVLNVFESHVSSISSSGVCETLSRAQMAGSVVDIFDSSYHVPKSSGFRHGKLDA